MTNAFKLFCLRDGKKWWRKVNTGQISAYHSIDLEAMRSGASLYNMYILNMCVCVCEVETLWNRDDLALEVSGLHQCYAMYTSSRAPAIRESCVYTQVSQFPFLCQSLQTLSKHLHFTCMVYGLQDFLALFHSFKWHNNQISWMELALCASFSMPMLMDENQTTQTNRQNEIHHSKLKYNGKTWNATKSLMIIAF